MTFVAQLLFVIWKPFSTNLFLFGANCQLVLLSSLENTSVVCKVFFKMRLSFHGFPLEKEGRISAFIIDETMVQIRGRNETWLLIAIEQSIAQF